MLKFCLCQISLGGWSGILRAEVITSTSFLEVHCIFKNSEAYLESALWCKWLGSCLHSGIPYWRVSRTPATPILMQFPASALGKAEEHHSNTWVTATCVVGQGGSPGSWLQLGAVVAVVNIWGFYQ